jgi:uridylate kinase
MKLAIKLSGSLFPAKLKLSRIKSYADLIKELHEKGHKMIIVTGGGENARSYIEAARNLGASEAVCDQLGIYATWLNARLLIIALEDIAFPEVPKSVEELKQYFTSGKVVIMGGLQPGQSTNAVAAIAAEAIKSDILINVTDVEGVYTRDPKKHPDAKKLDEISVKRLLQMALSGEIWAGGYELIDPVAVMIIERSRIPAWIISGDNPANVKKVLEGEKIGTKITHN